MENLLLLPIYAILPVVITAISMPAPVKSIPTDFAKAEPLFICGNQAEALSNFRQC